MSVLRVRSPVSEFRRAWSVGGSARRALAPSPTLSRSDAPRCTLFGLRTSDFGLRTSGFLFALLTLATAPALCADTPVSPRASAEAQALLSCFWDTYGHRTISGQHQGWLGTNDLGFELNYIRRLTGKLPALREMDLAASVPRDPAHAGRERLLARLATEWYFRSNGIVALCWHWPAPLGDPSVYTKETSFDLDRALIEGTAEHKALLRDLDRAAGQLKLLRDAHVPVLWRPLHEANGRWFWWGAKGPTAFKRLWRLVFERFTVRHKLNNLLWVFSPGASIDLADWYPGDEYVDIIGQDHYPMDGNNGPATDIFNELAALTKGGKLVALSENGPIPDIDRVVSEKADWLFFTTWSGRTLTERNSKEALFKAYTHPRVLNLGDLPNLKDHPFRPAGKPAQLGFLSAPDEFPVGSSGRRAILVAIQDAAGRTVREGSFEVSLSLQANSGGGHLGGTLAASSVNGIATFADLRIDRAGNGYALRAAAKTLRPAVSSSFQVGPGAGVVRECWTNRPGVSLAELSNLADEPTGRVLLSRAFEAPVQFATNFLARFRGSIFPPMTGAYTFWIASDGTSELWLSSDATSTNKVLIACVTASTPYCKWPHTHEAQSTPVNLEAGKSYCLEVLQKQHAGSTHLSLRWRLPNGLEQRPIPADRLAPFISGSEPRSHTATGLEQQ